MQLDEVRLFFRRYSNTGFLEPAVSSEYSTVYLIGNSRL